VAHLPHSPDSAAAPDAPVFRGSNHRFSGLLRRFIRIGGRRSGSGGTPHAAATTSAEARAAIDRINQSLESSFVALGSHFEPLTTHMQILVASSECLRRLAPGTSGGSSIFQEAIAHLQGPLGHIDSCAAEQPRLLELLGGCAEEMRRMLAFQTRLQDVLAPLSFVEILFKVESASLDLELRETFSTVAADIQRLRTLVNEAFRGNAELLASTHATIVGVSRKLSTDLQAHARASAEKRARITAALDRLEARLAQGARGDVDASSLSRDLATHIGTVVGGVQYQDIVMQKCSHVRTALEEWEQGGACDRTLLTVQIAQLDGALADIDAALEQIDSGIQKTRDLARSIDERCSAQDGLQGMAAAADDMIRLLLEAMRETREIVSGSTRLLQEAHAAVRPAGDVAGSMTSALGELSINMRLVALNAQVRSVQLSSGTGLEVLAVRTAEISNHITTVSTDITNHLDHLRSVTGGMFAHFESLQRLGADQENALTVGSGPIEARLQQLSAETHNGFTAIGHAVDSVRTVAGAAEAGLRQIATDREALRLTVDRLRGAAEVHRGTRDPASSDRTASHARIYTMESERRIHDAIAHGRYPLNAAQDPTAGSTELFVEVSGAGPRAADTESPSRPRDTAPRMSQPASSLGSNVDLF